MRNPALIGPSVSRRLSVMLPVMLIAAQLLVAQDRGLAVQARQVTGDPSFDIGRQYAVIIGIDRYQEWNSLRNAVSEARNVKAILESRYYIDEFIELYDGAATAAGIRKLFAETLPRKIRKEDSLFIFYAGHGYLDSSNTGFWIASDGVKDVFDQRGWIPNQQIRNYLSLLKAQRVLVVADACFSGDFLNVSRGAGPTIDSAYFAKALKLQARQVLTSGASETVPDESEFGRYFVTTLERNADPILDPHSLYDRIRSNVTKTVPLLGTIPGNEAGASFAFFLRPSYGSVSVAVATSANVEVDGRGLGAAEPGKPLLLKDLSAGIHELRVIYGDSEERRSILVRSGETSSEGFDYRAPRFGSLTVSAQAEATVLVDGKPVGSIAAGSTLVLPGVAEGERVVTLQYSDNQETRKLVVYPDTANAVSFAYRQESFASVAFEGFPDGAVIYSAGRELGTIAAGRFTAGGLAPGPRSFSVYHESWASPYLVAVDAAARSTATAAFKGGRIVALSVPRNVQIAVDGKVVARGDGLRDEYDLGLFPEGSHSVSFTGDNWDQQRSTASVAHGATVRVTASMTMRPGSSGGQATPSGTAASGSGGYSGGSGFGGLRVKYLWGSSDEVVARITKEGEDDSLPISLEQTNLFSAGRYVLEAKLGNDWEWMFKQEIEIVPGSEQSLSIPHLDFSNSWKISDLTIQRSLAFDRLVAIQKARKSRAAISNLGAVIGLAGLGVAVYGIVDGTSAYPEYQVAATPAEALLLRQRLVLDQNYLVFGLAGSGASFLLWTVRFGKQEELRNAQDEIDRLERMIDELRSQE
ncbi:MAG TPA: caspase family protein [Spirochaetales bacterium]|nr:caspase family protein [Spirochaetales bacterium]